MKSILAAVVLLAAPVFGQAPGLSPPLPPAIPPTMAHVWLYPDHRFISFDVSTGGRSGSYRSFN
jgi:hypothetical protein